MRDTARNAGSNGGVGLICVAATLMAIGVVAVFSASAPLDGFSADGEFIFDVIAKQAAFALCGFLLLVVMAKWPYQITGRAWLAIPLVMAALLLLTAVYVPGVGVERNGARRWVSLAGFTFQPSEPAKLALVIFIAFWAARGGRSLREFRWGLMPALLIAGVVLGLIGIEDFGTGALLAVVAGLMLLVGGARLWHLVLLSLPAATAFGLMLISRPSRVRRLTAFADIWADPLGSGYQAIQSLCAIAGGGWWGKGLGLGIQKHDYLPEAHNDFIFAIICEELGGVGGLAVIGLFAALVWLGMRAMRGAPDAFGRMLAFGLTTLIGLQATMNIAVVTASVPTKGIGLPLVSAGGSGVLVMAATVGMLANVARHGVGRATLRTSEGLLADLPAA